MAKSQMSDSYRIAKELFRDMLRRESPETLELLEDIHAADVIVVAGQYDHIDQVLDVAETPYTHITPPMLDKADLRADQVVFINCPGQVSRTGIGKLEQFVRTGGFLFTTDWALKYVIELAFPGYLSYNNQKSKDEVVRVEILEDDDSFLVNLFDEDDDPQWWLEGSSFPITLEDPEKVRVLIRSKEIEQRYGESPVLVTFEYGEGLVYHMISHFYLQRSETRTARHRRLSMSYLKQKGIPEESMERYLRMGAADLSTSDLESAFTSHAWSHSLILEKKRRAAEARKKKGGKK